MSSIRVAAVVVAMSLSPGIWAATTPTAKAALQAYFDSPENSRRMYVWADKSGHYVEVSTDYGLLGVGPVSSDSAGRQSLWDAMFLLKYYIDLDNVDTDKFRALHAPTAGRIVETYSQLGCSAGNDPEAKATCLVRELSKKYGLSFFAVRTDEGYRCSIRLSDADFKTPTGSRRCVDLIKRKK